MKMEFITEHDKRLHEDCSTLLAPALSIGNVAQLAVDLLVSSTAAERVGCLDDPYVLPGVGNDAYTSSIGDLSLPLEVYESPDNAISLLQQRSPVTKGMMIEFAKHLADFAALSGKKHVIILSSLDFGRWRQIDMSSGLQMFYLSSTNADGTDDLCEQFGWKRLQEYDPAQRSWRLLCTLSEGKNLLDNSFPFEDELQEEEEDYYPSLSFAALFSCFKAKGLKVTCVLCYCSEGDNTSDAFHLAGAASKLFERSPNNFNGDNGGKWVIPVSWRTVYGPPPDSSIF